MNKKKKMLIGIGSISVGMLSLCFVGTKYLIGHETLEPKEEAPQFVHKIANTLNNYTLWAEEHLVFKNYEYSEIGNETINQTNQGIVAENGQWTFYTDGESIYRVTEGNSTSEAREIPVAKNGEVKDLNVTEEHLVYRVMLDAYESILIVADIDGSNAEIVTEANVNYVQVVNNKVYYSNVDDGFRYYSYDLETEETEIVIDSPAFCPVATEEYIYFTDGFFAPTPEEQAIYRVDLDGGNKTKIATTPAWNLQVTEEYIYYLESESSDGPLMRIPLEGGTPEMMIEELVTSFIVVDEMIYYSPPYTIEGYGFLKYDLKTGETTPINNVIYYDMAYCEGKIVMIDSMSGETVAYNPETNSLETYQF